MATTAWLCVAFGVPPVMQQQSMTLAGCAPNPWPLPSERAVVAARRGVPIVQAGETDDPVPPGGGAASMTPLENTCLARLGRAALRPWTRCL